MARAKRAEEEPLEIEAGSGNVFEDLGLPDAGERLARAELARVIRNIVKDKMVPETLSECGAAERPICCCRHGSLEEDRPPKVVILVAATVTKMTGNRVNS